MRTPLMLTLCALLAAAVAGCATPSDDHDDEPTTHTVSAVDHAYVPSTLSVHQHDSIFVSNDGEFPHTVTIHRGGTPVDEQQMDATLQPGDTVSYTFEEAGTYHVYCRFHSAGQAGEYSSGMVLTVSVAPH